MDLILYNGKIRIADGFTKAVAILGNRIERIGNDADICALKEPETRMIDLGGRLALPGFNDSHMHLLQYGYDRFGLDLRGVPSIEEAIELARAFIKKNKIEPGKWVYAYGYNDDYFAEKRNPTRRDLDRISTEHPVLFKRVCIHVNVVNSMGLSLLGIRKGAPRPLLGTFAVDEDEEPTGVLMDMTDFVINAIPEPSSEDIKAMILEAGREMVKSGITSVQTDDFRSVPGGNFAAIIDAYRQLAEEKRLPLRVYEQCALPTQARYDQFGEVGCRTGQGDDFFRLGPIKLFCDGSLGARTALLREPYSDAPDQRGLCLYEEPEQLHDLVERAHRNGMASAIHCIGDAAAHLAVSAIARAKSRYPDIPCRHGIVHAQILNEELMRDLEKLDIIAYVQPVFIENDLHIAESRVGRERMGFSYNWRDLLTAGVQVAFGTDCPVEDFQPMLNIYSAVTRKDLEGCPREGWYKEQALTVEESVQAYTAAGAYASYEENRKGKIQPGMLADIVVLERDIYQIKPEEIKNVEVSMTIVDGQIRYEKGDEYK